MGFKSQLFLAAALSATLVAVSGAAGATTIAGLYNTGVDASSVSTPSADHGADLHWVLGEGPAFTGLTNGSFPSPYWMDDDKTSRWITPTANAGDSFDPSAPGFYTYRLFFNLPTAAGASFTGRFAADNVVDGVYLNGVNISSGGGGFSFWTNFAATSGFNAGSNNLEFDVRNFAQNGGNPAGLRVEFLSSTASAVPEPATWAVMILGFGLAGAALRRRGAIIA